MSERITRRETLKRGLVATSLLALWSDWNFPALAQGETDVPFTDIPANFNTNPSATTRLLDIRKIDGPSRRRISSSPFSTSTGRKSIPPPIV